MTKESNHQGDVYVKSISELPKEAILQDAKDGKNILAYGEVTGHHHRFEDPHVRMFATNDNRRFVVIENAPAMLFHEEHSPIEFNPGVYEVFIAREWTDENEPRKVLD